MQTIIATIITGLFSLTGIWYQNYLNRRPNRSSSVPVASASGNVADGTESVSPVGSKQNYNPALRIIFTILIVTIPWISVNYWLRFVDKFTFIHSNTGKAVRHNIATVRNEIVIYCLVWIIITVAALLSGWKKKTLFEKALLIISAVCLVGSGIVGYVRYDRLL